MLERTLALCVCAALSVACSPPEPPAQASTKPSGPEPEAPPAAAAPDAPAPKPKPKPKPSTSGLAFINLRGVGIYRVDPDGWHELYAPRSPVRDLVELGGHLHLLSNSGVERLSSVGQVEQLATFGREVYAELGAPQTLAGDGELLWVLGQAGVARWDGEWQTTPLESIASAPDSSARALVTDSGGTPWLLLGGRVYRKQEGSWVALELADASGPALGLLASPEATLIHAGCSSGTCTVLRHTGEGTQVQRLAADTCTDYDALALSPGGEFVVLAGRCGVLRAAGDAASDLHLTRAQGWHGQPVQSLAVDTGGRVWVGTNNGLSIVDAQGHIEDYPQGQLSDISGVMADIVVRGDGAPAPYLGPERHTSLGGVAVRVVDGEKLAIANAKIELCRTLPLERGASPCTGSESRRESITDAGGKFAFSELVLDHYYLHVELDDGWARGEPRAMNLRAGMTGNVGKVVFEARE